MSTVRQRVSRRVSVHVVSNLEQILVSALRHPVGEFVQVEARHARRRRASGVHARVRARPRETRAIRRIESNRIES